MRDSEFDPLREVKDKLAQTAAKESLLKRLVADIVPTRRIESTRRGNWDYRFSSDFSKWRVYVSRKESAKLDLWDFAHLDNGLYAVVLDKGTESSGGVLSLFVASVHFILIGFADEVVLK